MMPQLQQQLQMSGLQHNVENAPPQGVRHLRPSPRLCCTMILLRHAVKVQVQRRLLSRTLFHDLKGSFFV